MLNQSWHNYLIGGMLLLLSSCGHSPTRNPPNQASQLLDSAWQIKDLNPQQALVLSQQALQSSEASDSIWCRARSRMAHAFAKLNQTDSALHQWSLLTTSCPEVGLTPQAELAAELLQQGAFAPASQLIRAGLKQATRVGDSSMLIHFSQTAARLHYDRNQPDSVRFYAGQALNLSQKLQFHSSSGRALTTLSVLYSETEQLDSAVHYAQLALQQMALGADQRGLADATSNLGYAFELSGVPDSAQRYYTSALQQAEAIGYLELVQDVKLNLADVALSRGDHNSALQLLYESNALKDSLVQAGFGQQLNELQFKYNTLQKERRLAQLAEKQRTTEWQRNALLLIAGLALLAIALVSLYFRQRNRFQQQMAQAEISRLNREKDVLALQSMLVAQEEERQRIARDLHDSIGALLSTARLQMTRVEMELQKMAEIDLVKNTESILARASTEVRRLAHHMMPGVLMELGLHEALKEFIAGLQGADTPVIRFTGEPPDERLPQKIEITVYRIVQELITNTIKHANASTISIQLDIVEGEKLTLDYRDDGQGFSTEAWDQENNFGLTSIKSRVRFLEGTLELPATEQVHVIISFTLS